MLQFLASPFAMLVTALQNSMKELESRSLRSLAESSSTHEAEQRATREQHQRELSCLKDELASERKR